jgi:hypothetical protein
MRKSERGGWRNGINKKKRKTKDKAIEVELSDRL